MEKLASCYVVRSSVDICCDKVSRDGVRNSTTCLVAVLCAMGSVQRSNVCVVGLAVVSDRMCKSCVGNCMCSSSKNSAHVPIRVLAVGLSRCCVFEGKYVVEHCAFDVRLGVVIVVN